ncbi:MAG: hypothetical protein KDD47_21825, partial [Acidobacteria bacterium]|nr:hypothetical protein [Acidobacteriota bacterium]
MNYRHLFAPGLLCLGLLTSSTAGVSQSLPCSSLIGGYIDALEAASPTSEGAASIVYKLAIAKSRSSAPGPFLGYGHGSFSEGTLALGGDGLRGTSWELFSDRNSRQPFPVRSSDLMALDLSRSGGVSLTLLTWGGATLPLRQARCFRDRFGGFVSGIVEEGNGTSLVSLSLHQDSLDGWGTLVIRWAGVIANADRGPRFGGNANDRTNSLWIAIHQADPRCGRGRRLDSGRVLLEAGPDPWRGWTDGSQSIIVPRALHSWRSAEDAVDVRIFDRDRHGRDTDTVICVRVERRETLGGQIVTDRSNTAG